MHVCTRFIFSRRLRPPPSRHARPAAAAAADTPAATVFLFCFLRGLPALLLRLMARRYRQFLFTFSSRRRRCHCLATILPISVVKAAIDFLIDDSTPPMLISMADFADIIVTTPSRPMPAAGLPSHIFAQSSRRAIFFALFSFSFTGHFASAAFRHYFFAIFAIIFAAFFVRCRHMPS